MVYNHSQWKAKVKLVGMHGPVVVYQGQSLCKATVISFLQPIMAPCCFISPKSWMCSFDKTHKLCHAIAEKNIKHWCKNCWIYI